MRRGSVSVQSCLTLVLLIIFNFGLLIVDHILPMLNYSNSVVIFVGGKKLLGTCSSKVGVKWPASWLFLLKLVKG